MEKVETSLTPMPRSPRAVRRAIVAYRRTRRCCCCVRVPAASGLLQGRRPGDITAVAFRCAMRRSASFGETPHEAFPGVGLSSLCHGVTGHVPERESNPRQSASKLTLYPTELSSGGRTGFEPVANGLRRCSAAELSSARETPPRGLRHTPRQCRAHRLELKSPGR